MSPMLEIITFFLAFCFYANHATAQSITENGASCSRSIDYRNGSLSADSVAMYESNVQQLKPIFSSNAIDGRLFGETIIGNDTSNMVYGLYLCRGDIDTNACRYCVSSASERIFQFCPNGTSGEMYYDVCMLRFANHNFSGQFTESAGGWQIGNRGLSDPVEIEEGENQMRNLIEKVAENPSKLYATHEYQLNETEKRYSLAQCSLDLNVTACGQCLQYLLRQVLQSKIGWWAVHPSCTFRSENFLFYAKSNTTTLAVLNPDNGAC